MTGKRGWASSPLIRLLCLGISLLLLLMVLNRVNFSLLRSTLLQASLPWFAASIGAFAFALFAASWRLHLVLRLTHLQVHHTATIRSVWAGHFFYTAYFGGVAGDTARSALYARWFEFPFGKILATAPLDRLFGLIGLILLALLALVPRFFSNAPHLPFEIKSGWPLAGGAALFLLLLAFRPWKMVRATWFQQGWSTLTRGLAVLARRPRLLCEGSMAGLAVHVGLSSVLALNLMAVSSRDLPWGQILWTFPAIFIISAFPITVAGLGLRESAAVALLGLYEIPMTEAVAAALLSFPANLFCALVGGGVVLNEERRFNRAIDRPLPSTVSIVIPVLNESEQLPRIVPALRQHPAVHEILVVDGGSGDTTVQVAKQLGCRVISSERGRGRQLRAGAKQSTGDLVLLLHADTCLTEGALEAMLQAARDRTLVGGGFWKVFDHPHWLMRGSRLKCALRFYLGQRVMGDQAMFVRRDVLEEIGGVPEVALMEEFELCRRLREKGRLGLAGGKVITSARRFREKGTLRTYWRMWRVLIQYNLGRSPEELRKLYER